MADDASIAAPDTRGKSLKCVAWSYTRIGRKDNMHDEATNEVSENACSNHCNTYHLLKCHSTVKAHHSYGLKNPSPTHEIYSSFVAPIHVHIHPKNKAI